MYMTSWCGDCKRSKHLLDSHQVQYSEVNIEEDDEAMKYVQSVNNGMNSVPTIVFSDGSTLTEPSNDQLEQKLKQLNIL